jgi:signal transduction histidine kinase
LKVDLPEQPALISADPQSLTQLIVNLSINAIEAAAQSQLTPPAAADSTNKPVEIRLTRENDNRFELAIGNPGPGPAPAIQPRLFEPFATDKAGGTGLGLAVVKQIAEDHRGSVRWRREDTTTWFVVQLPAAEHKIR